MNLDSFFDELEKIAFVRNIARHGSTKQGAGMAIDKAREVYRGRGKKKEAGFLRDVGSNVGNTLKGFTNPVAALKKGWNEGGWTTGQEARQMVAAGKGHQLNKYLGARWAQGKGVGRFLPGSKALTLAGGAMMLPEAVKEEDPTGQGRSRTERMSRFAGNQVGGLIGAPYGFSGAIAGSLVGEIGAGAVGKQVGKVLPKKKAPATPPAASQPPANVQPPDNDGMR